MTDFFTQTPYAYDNQTDAENVPHSGVRLYRNTPETLHLQIRTHTGDKKRARYAGASLSLDQAEQLLEALRANIAELKEGVSPDGLKLPAPRPRYTKEQLTGANLQATLDSTSSDEEILEIVKALRQYGLAVPRNLEV